MHLYEQLIYDRFSKRIAGWASEGISGVYAVALTYESYWSADSAGQEVAIQGQISLGFNTLTHYATQVPEASCAEEARWNLRFWLQSRSVTVPGEFEYGADPPDDELALRDAWCAVHGVLPTGQDGGGRVTYNELALYEAARGACQLVARTLHRNHVLDTIGKPVPIIIQTHEGSEVDAIATRDANPAGLSREAEEWLLGRTYAQIAAYEGLLDEVKRLPALEQAEFWTAVLRAFALDLPSDARSRLQAMARSKSDVVEALATVGPAAVPLLVQLVEEYALREQHRPPVSSSARHGEWTPESQLTTYALEAVRRIGTAENTEVLRLFAVLTQLYPDGIGKDWIGTNLALVASTLHRLRPQRFPPPKVGSSSNKLLNYREFLLMPSNPAR